MPLLVIESEQKFNFENALIKVMVLIPSCDYFQCNFEVLTRLNMMI